MQLLPMNKLGPHELPGNKIRFGLLLPWVSADHGNRLWVKIIHEDDQFLQDIVPLSFELAHSVDETYGDFWSAEVVIDVADRAIESSSWGRPGRYVYRFELKSPLRAEPLDWIIDPYAREHGIGKQSAFTLGYQGYVWDDGENDWKTPKVHDLVAYEIMLNEFDQGLEGAIDRLPYLRDLGVNCLEIMPVSNAVRSVDWGFEPVGHFGVDERFGKRRNFQAFIQAAHAHGIAVMLDMIYGHTSTHFAYEYVYNNLGYRDNPFMGSFAKDMFGPSTDFGRKFTQDYYFTVNHYWLDRYHADGIRYDCVPNYWDGVTGVGYANLVYQTYQTIKDKGGDGHWGRFFSGDRINVIQCAEQLEAPVEVVNKTYSSCTWQNETLGAAHEIARGNKHALTDFGHRLGLTGYELEVTSNGDTIDKSAMQYLENHDHSRLLCSFGTKDLYRGVILEGDRTRWYKLQPYVMAIFLAKGIPMLWQGQEIVEKYHVPGHGMARIGVLRPVRWELFYDEVGKGMIHLIRKLISLRNDDSVFRQGQFHFHNHWDRWQSQGLLLFSRWDGQSDTLVALNFGDHDQSTHFWFPSAGTYTERLNGDDLLGVRAGQATQITIPSNYGRIYSSTS